MDTTTGSHLKDGTALYEVERRARYGERPGFRITELQIGPTQEVPWHAHTHAQDTFYVMQGEIRLSLREPEQELRLRRGLSAANWEMRLVPTTAPTVRRSSPAGP